MKEVMLWLGADQIGNEHLFLARIFSLMTGRLLPIFMVLLSRKIKLSNYLIF